MDIFNRIKSQYIDNYGKCRAVNFTNFSLITSPIPPFDVPESSNIIYCDINIAKKVIVENNFEILFQQRYSDREISGLWIYAGDELQSFLVNIFLPTKLTNNLPNIEFAPEQLYEPINRNAFSSLDKNNEALKISIFLKEYTLFTYSLFPDTFSIENFIVIPNYIYNLNKIGKRIFYRGNDVMYKDSKIVVPSEEIRDKLIQFLEITKLNDKYKVENYKYRNIISDYYHSLKDFRSKELQLIFLDTQSLFKWRDKHFDRSYNTISYKIIPGIENPYYYINQNISDSILLIQNVQNGELLRALRVCKEWDEFRTNTKGYHAEPLKDKNIGYNIYYTNGFSKKIGDGKLDILEIKDNVYCAILKFYED